MQGLVSVLLMLGSFAMAGEGMYQGKEMADAAKDLVAKGVTVIDVRQEACDGYVKGSHIISIDEITEKSSDALKKVNELTKNNKNAKIAIYCRAGRRAEKALKVLQEVGYTNLTNLGGLDGYFDSTTMEKCKQ